MYQWEDLYLDPDACEVRYKGQTLHLYPKEYELLKLFLTYPNHVLSPSVIIDNLWFCDSIPTEGTLRTHIKGLRRKLKEAGADDLIQTVHSLGYRLKPVPKNPIQSNSSLSPMLMKLLAVHSMEYAIVARSLAIQEFSSNVYNFSDYPFELVVGQPVTLAFPELIGLEPILLEILEHQRPNFYIKEIARACNSSRPNYINVHLMAEPTEKASNQRLILLFEDCSEQMVWKQQVVQKENEYHLLLSSNKGASPLELELD
jgi:DNA-binding winged helix-turn-helix (wHTH) protein